jgi:hypothetical protein
MALSHADYHYSVTVQTDDRAVVNCLRSLSQISQQQGNVRIPWGGTTDAAWEQAGHAVTFRFTSPTYRQGFIDVAERILRPGLWREVSRSDSDPASPQGES